MNKTIVKTLSYIGAAVKEGQPRHGVAKGPQVIRQSGVFENLKQVYGVEKIVDYGDVSINSLPKDVLQRPPIPHKINNLHLLDPLLLQVKNTVKKALDSEEKDNVVVTVGGDHSIGSATISAALQKNKDVKLVWVDAHADFGIPANKVKDPSANYHGMPLSHVCGIGGLPGFEWMKNNMPFQNIVLIGIRDIDYDEFISLKQNNVKCFTMEQVARFGIGAIMDKTIEYLDPHNKHPFHISFDVDGCDPSLVSQTGTLYRDGLNYRQSCHIVKRLAYERRVLSMDVVEINPELGDNTPRKNYRDEQLLNKNISQTVGLGVDLIQSLCPQNMIL